MAPRADDVAIAKKPPRRLEQPGQRASAGQRRRVEPEVKGRRGGERAARRRQPIERLARLDAAERPLHEFVGRVPGAPLAAVGPGVRLADGADQIARALAQHRGGVGARAGAGAGARPAAARARVGAARLLRELRVDHGPEGREQRQKARRITLERAEHVRERLDRRDVRLARLAANAVIARPGGREGVARQRRELGVQPQELLRLPPGAVQNHQGDRPARRIGRHVGGVGPGVEQHGRPTHAGQHPAQCPALAKGDAHVQLGVREAKVRHPGGADGDVALARVLQQHHARRRLDAAEVGAIAHARRPLAARAGLARPKLAPRRGRGPTPAAPGGARGRVGLAHPSPRLPSSRARARAPNLAPLASESPARTAPIGPEPSTETFFIAHAIARGVARVQAPTSAPPVPAP